MLAPFRAPGFGGEKFFPVTRVERHGRDEAEPRGVACDAAHAGVGEQGAIALARTASHVTPERSVPVGAAVVSVVDRVHGEPAL